MTKKRWLVGILALVVVLALLVPVSCAKPEAPAPGERPIVNLKLWAGKPGASSYACYYALSQVLLKHSAWLRVTLVETGGSVENAKLAAEPENRKAAIGNCNVFTATDFRLARRAFVGREPVDLKAISMNNVCSGGWGTFDPNIRTIADLKGKTVSCLLKASYYDGLLEPLLEIYGIRDQVKIEYAYFAKGNEGLRSGALDAAQVFATGADGAWGLNTATAELATYGELYTIELNEADVLKANEMSGYPHHVKMVPAGTIAGFDRDFYGFGFVNALYAHPEQSDDVTYEIVRMFVEYPREFDQYHPVHKGYKPEVFPNTYEPRENYHPGALKYYDAAGIKIIEP
ncbi:TAXI family TRAP transporter solute-binding subunit [Chloroflexota bacterium]